MTMEWDVIVAGAGAAGLSAAISSADAGARVIMFETESSVGGSMALSGGVFCAAGTSVQAALGIEDSPERWFRHYMDLNQWVLRTGLIRTFCVQSTATFEWLLGMGLEVPAKLSASGQQPGVFSLREGEISRGHVPVGEGYALTELLDKARRDRRIDVVFNTRIEQLIIEDGRTCGVVADDVEARADAVVITTGGMARSPELLQKYFPDVRIAGDDLFVVSGPGSRGDHISLGGQAGCSIVGQGWGMMLACAYFQGLHHTRAGHPPLSRLLVDGSGRRFANEDATYTPMFNLLKQAGGSAWMIFDEAGRLGLDPTYASWTPDNVLAEVAAGRTSRGDDARELAAQIGVAPSALAATLDRWNATLPVGTDPDFGRDETLAALGYGSPEPMSKPPFYAVRVLPAQLIQTHAGLEIDQHAQVIDNVGRPVPGLYAAGEAGGGVLGPHYVGATALANALTMGRIAGASAAAR
jgi:succinate dehydrogenase/fumarate reductase flavoprotein subunit